MSYKCSICEKTVPAGSQMKKHVLYKEDGNIRRELPVCLDCDAGLRSGYSLEMMRQLVGPKRAMPDALRHLPRTNPQLEESAPEVKPISRSR